MARQQQLIVENFKYGMDRRRSYLTSVPGTLYTLKNAHVSQGGAIEKRKAFVRLLNSSGALATSLPTGTFGLQHTATGLLVFGSADQSGSTWPSGVTYQRLRHPDGTTAMTAVLHSELFNGAAWVVARFGTAGTFGFYNGTLVYDFTNGLVMAHNATPPLIAAEIVAELTRQGRYTGTHRASISTLSAGRTSNIVTIITAVNHGLSTGDVVNVTGLVGYPTINAFNKVITVTALNTFTYPQTGSDLSPAGDGAGIVSSGEVFVDGPVGVDYLAAFDVHSSLHGTVIGPTNTLLPVAPRDGISAVGSFRVMGGSASAGVNKVTSVKIDTTEVLGGIGSVDFATSNSVTAANIALNITNAAVGGVFATATDNTVYLYSPTASAATYNGKKVTVTAAGNVCIGDCMFYLTAPYPTGSITAITVGGVSILGATVSYSVGVNTLANVYSTIETQVNAGTATHGMIAFASETFIQLSRKVTSSLDLDIAVYLSLPKTGTPVNDGLGGVFGAPPAAAVPLSVKLLDAVFDAGASGDPVFGTTVVTALPSGGSGVYTSYTWRAETVGVSDRGLVQRGSNSTNYDTWIISPQSTNTPSTIFKLSGTLIRGLYTARFVCLVTDTYGVTAISNTLQISFQIF